MGHSGLVFDGRMLSVAVAGLVAALLAWALMAAPAFAQDADADAGDDGAQAGNVDIQYVDCSQVQAAFANQNNSGDAGAVAGQYGDATASIAQELGISQEQANACLSETGGAPTDNRTDNGTDDGTEGDVDSSADVDADTISEKPLPNTGGAPLPAAVFGLALVAAGILSAGSIVRRGR